MNEQNNDPKLTEALHKAYPSQEPAPELHGRMVDAERDARVRSHRSGSGWKKGWLVLLGSAAVLSVLGFTVYKIFFDRPGEAAIALIPSDADMVLTLDTNPSTRQVATFQKIAQALDKEGLLGKVDDLLSMTLDQNVLVRQIRPNVSKNLALAVWMPKQSIKEGAEPEGVAAFLALKDTGLVRDALTKWLGRQERDGLSYYTLDKKGSAAIISDYLVFAQTPELLMRIYQVEQGKAQSIAQLAAYKEARASLAEDANLMFFISADAMNRLDQTAKGFANGASPLGGASWLAMGVAIRDQGLELTYQCPMDQTRMASLQRLSEIQPIDKGLLNKLPQGAYGVLAFSQPSKYWSFISETAAQKPKDKQEMEEGLAKFEKETGMSIPRDVVPAFDGNLVLAVYPSPGAADGIVILDDANQANPAAFAAKVRALIERKSAEDGKPVRFVSADIGGATVWKLDKASQEELTGGFNGPNAQAEIVPGHEAPGQNDPPVFKEAPVKSTPNPALKDKTIAYAQVGNAVIIASSEAMLVRAIDAYNGKGATLAGDPAFAYASDTLRDNAQSMIVVNLNRIMETMRPQIEQSGGPVEDIVNLFGGPGVSLVGSGSYDGKVMTGEMFLPLDYTRLVKMMGEGMRQGQKQMPPPDIMSKDGAPKFGMKIARASRVLARL
ncbi:MAG: DUF3352 domain-containing protein [Fimbriimonadaceae bacterium]